MKQKQIRQTPISLKAATPVQGRQKKAKEPSLKRATRSSLEEQVRQQTDEIRIKKG